MAEDDDESCLWSCEMEMCVEGPLAPVFKNGVSDEEMERVLFQCFDTCRDQCTEEQP